MISYVREFLSRIFRNFNFLLLQTELCERRRGAIIKKYTKCHNDRNFCHNYFKRSMEDRPVSKLSAKLADLKKEFGFILN